MPPTSLDLSYLLRAAILPLPYGSSPGRLSAAARLFESVCYVTLPHKIVSTDDRGTAFPHIFRAGQLVQNIARLLTKYPPTTYGALRSTRSQLLIRSCRRR